MKVNQIRNNIFIFAIIFLTSCSQVVGRPNNAPPLKLMDKVEIEKYLGQWYEIARYPNSFEKNCINVTANYSLRNDGKVNVINTCVKNDSGKTKSAKAIATIIPNSNNTKIAVNFAPIPLPKGDGNYHIIYVSDDYSKAIVGEPKGKYLWFLARNSKITQSESQELEAIAKANLYDVSLLEYVEQR